MPARDDIRDGMAEAANVLAEEFFYGQTAKLLKPSLTYDEFDTVLELSGGWFFEKPTFTLADDTDATAAAMALATHVQIGDVIYVLGAGKELTPTQTGEPLWTIECEVYQKGDPYANL